MNSKKYYNYKRSYAKIKYRKDILGLHMVNPHANDFFIYAEPLITLYEYPEVYNLVKIRDKDLSKNNYDYQGEIWGKMSVSNVIDPEGSELYASILLCFGAAGKAVNFVKKDTKPRGIVEEQRYLFPFDEFECFLIAIEAMETQHRDFSALKRGSRVLTDKKIKARNLRERYRDKLF